MNDAKPASTYRFTAEQMTTACALAVAYDLHWASLTPDELVGLTSAEMADKVCVRTGSTIDGYYQTLLMTDDGGIVARLAAHRLQWVIKRDGTVVFEVSRFSPRSDCEVEICVLNITIPFVPFAQADPDAPHVWNWCWMTSDCLPKHIETAHKAVRALWDVNPNALIVSAWLDGQKPRTELAAHWELIDKIDDIETDSEAQVGQAIEALSWRLRDDDSESIPEAKERLHRIKQQLVALAHELQGLYDAAQ